MAAELASPRIRGELERALANLARSIIEDMRKLHAAPIDLGWLLFVINQNPEWFRALLLEMSIESKNVSPDKAREAQRAPIPTPREVVVPSTASHYFAL